MVIEPKLSVIRGGKDKDAPRRLVYWTSAAATRIAEHSAEPKPDVIPILDGWIRILERQARAMEP